MDGTSVIKYLYSGDVTVSYYYVRQNLLDGLQGMADGNFAVLLAGFDTTQPATGFAICSDAELAAAMDENWISASYVGSLYHPGLTVKSEINSNLYDLDEGFKAVIDAQTEERIAIIDNPVNAEKCIVSHFDVNSTDNIYYTVENCQVIKYIDSDVYYSCEATTVIYTKVELESAATYAITLPESFENGLVTCDKETAAEGETVH